MDRASTVVIAAVAGTMSCGSPVGADRPESTTDALVNGDVGSTARTAPEEGSISGPELESITYRPSASRAFDAESIATSTATADDGSRYVAGVFSGTIRLGAHELQSRGGDDIFVARVRPPGGVAWARAIGSKGEESSPKVTFDDGRVTIVAMTNGAVDCGQGPLNTWSTETFFVCTFGPDGAPINGGTFPTGRQ
jgi:hypothetical protein